MKRILLVSTSSEYGDPGRGEAFEERFFHEPLRHLAGAQVEHFDFTAVSHALGQARMTELLKERVLSSRPDLVFLVPFDDRLDPLRAAVEALPATTLAWMSDDQWRFESFSRHWSPHVDWIVTTDPDAAVRHESLGAATILSQWATNPRLYVPHELPQDIDVSFVGQPHGERREIVARLRARGLRVAVFGSGWGAEGTRLSFDEMLRVFARSKVNLNFTNCWAEPSRQMKARSFEVPGCGAFLLSQDAPGLASCFAIGEEIAVFRDEAELVERARWFVAHADERREIAARGHERCLREHTWDQRLRAILDTVDAGAGAGTGAGRNGRGSGAGSGRGRGSVSGRGSGSGSGPA